MNTDRWSGQIEPMCNAGRDVILVSRQHGGELADPRNKFGICVHVLPQIFRTVHTGKHTNSVTVARGAIRRVTGTFEHFP